MKWTDLLQFVQRMSRGRRYFVPTLRTLHLPSFEASRKTPRVLPTARDTILSVRTQVPAELAARALPS